jgi:hypothetical protein
MKVPLPALRGRGAWPGEEMASRSPEAESMESVVRPSRELTWREAAEKRGRLQSRRRRRMAFMFAGDSRRLLKEGKEDATVFGELLRLCSGA